jgi:CheY-like chemotaxis protein
MTTIFVIDDDPEFLSNLAELLEFEGFNVIVSLDGAEALENLRERPVDLILCDMLMKPMDGMKIMRAVRANPDIAHIPFVFITGLRPDEIKGGVAEASGFLIKPFTNDTLLNVIAEHVAVGY